MNVSFCVCLCVCCVLVCLCVFVCSLFFFFKKRGFARSLGFADFLAAVPIFEKQPTTGRAEGKCPKPSDCHTRCGLCLDEVTSHTSRACVQLAQGSPHGGSRGRRAGRNSQLLPKKAAVGMVSATGTPTEYHSHRRGRFRGSRQVRVLLGRAESRMLRWPGRWTDKMTERRRRDVCVGRTRKSRWRQM